MLDAALRVFAERGYHGTAVPEIAAAAKVGTGSLYRHFATKEVLVNEVYRDAKSRLGKALLDGLDLGSPGDAWFPEAWSRLSRFARAEPDAFRFLEMQDHVPYLDEASRQMELSVLTPLFLAGQRIRDERAANSPSREADARPSPLPVDVAIALIWGAFVGLIKAERLGYLRLTDEAITAAGEALWGVVMPGRSPSPNAQAQNAHAHVLSPTPPSNERSSSNSKRRK
ncbi:MAG: TetR/AcrR family transcriptional regulator [Polyangiaceae bacterium]